MKGGFVYIISNGFNNVLYTGVTSDIVSRTIQHKEKHYPESFTARYNMDKLLYFKFFDSIETAIEQEKYIKGKSKNFKLDLIKRRNFSFIDLWEEIKYW